ncbi:MAG: glycoside hydrolase family 16 protein [Planctomycetota bacterium]
MKTRLLTTAALLSGLTVSLVPAASGQVILRDDFNGTGNIDWETWRIPFGGDGSFLGRTQLGTDPNVDVPQQVGGSAVIELDTFSVIDPGNAFFGQEFQTRGSYARGGGLAVEYRARIDPTSVPAGIGGVVGGLFSYDLTGDGIRDEIDTAELLTNEIVNGQNRNFTNLWNDGDFSNGGNPAFVNAPTDLTQFNTYRTVWNPDSVQWFVNGQLVRTVTGADVPDDPMSVRANIWAPDATFSEAFDASLQPAATVGAGETIQMEIDYIEIERLNTTVGDNLLADGSFEQGLTTTDPAGADGRWFFFNNAATSTEIAASDGVSLLKTFGPFKPFQTDASGGFQDVPAQAGQEFEISIDAFTPELDSIVGTNNFAAFAVEFLDASKAQLGNRSEISLIDGRDPNAIENEFVSGVTNSIAPDDTAFIRIVPLFVQLIDGNEQSSGIGDAGSVFFDNAQIRLIEAAVALGLVGDYDGDNQVAQGDLNLVLNNWGQARTFEDPGGTVFTTANVDQEELNGVLNNWGAQAAPSFNGSAVPEPATLAALGGLALLGLRRRG